MDADYLGENGRAGGSKGIEGTGRAEGTGHLDGNDDGRAGGVGRDGCVERARVNSGAGQNPSRRRHYPVDRTEFAGLAQAGAEPDLPSV